MDAATPAQPESARHRIGARLAPDRGTLVAWAVLAAVAVCAVAATAALLLPRLRALPESAPAPPAAAGQAEQAYSLVRDPDSEVILRIPLDGSFGNYIELPTTGRVPDFPTSGTTQWVMPLGEYFGWDLWIAGARGALQGEHCILIERDDRTRARCVPAALRAQSALLVSVPFDLISTAERPPGMVDGERIGFWWGEDTEVTALLGPEHER
jgi:hypothetical protein